MLEQLPDAHGSDVVDHVQRDEGFAGIHVAGLADFALTRN
jgi:hypothetical protein